MMTGKLCLVFFQKAWTHILTGDPEREIPSFIETHDAGILVNDFDPLHIKRGWKEEVAQRIDTPISRWMPIISRFSKAGICGIYNKA